MELFSRHLRIAMAARGVSQSDLAQRIDVSRAFMNNVINGKKMPSSGRLVEIARILGVSVDYLMGGEDVEGRIEDVMQNRIVRKTLHQLYLEDAARKWGAE